MGVMGRSFGLIGVLAVVLTCGPTALPRDDAGAPTALLVPAPTSNDVITVREGGAQSYIAVRKVMSSELTKQLPDGVLLPDRRTIAVVESAVSTTMFRTVDRFTGKTLGSRTLSGTWTMPLGAFGYPATSPNGFHVVMAGSSYNFTDQTGTWTAKTTFAVVNTAFKFDQPNILQLDGRYTYAGISNDGRALYLYESIPPQLPTSTRLRVYDLRLSSFADVSGDVADPNAYTHVSPISIGPSTFELFGGASPKVVARDLDARTVRVLDLPAEQGTNAGEIGLMWALVAARDGKTLYAINAAMGFVDEIDPVSLQLRRSAHLARSSSPDRGVVARLMNAMHPVANAKRGFYGVGAVLSPDGTTIYAMGETGVWAIDTRTLNGRALTKNGSYWSIAIEPTGQRIYVLGIEDGIVRVLSARDGTVLGAMKRVAYPTEIVAVDSGD